MTELEPVRLAVIGCGAVVERCHLPAVRQLRGVKLSAMVDPNPARLRRASRRAPGARLCTRLDELPGIDAAVVAVPNALHAPVSIELLRRGIHVLCEKPMATTVEACHAMISAARESGRVLMIGHHKRFVPSVQMAKELVAGGRIGMVQLVTASMGMPRTWQTYSGFHRDPALAGGGVLIDTGVHLIDLVLWLLGPATLTRSFTLGNTGGVEEEAKVEIVTSSGAAGVLRFSHRQVLPNVMRIEGDRGVLEFDTYDDPSLKVFAEDSRLCGATGSLLFTWKRTSPYTAQLDHFIRIVRAADPVTHDGDEVALQAIRLVTQAYEKAEQFV